MGVVSTYIPPIGLGMMLRTERGFQRIAELGTAVLFPIGTSIQPTRLDDGTHCLVVCEGGRFWMFKAAIRPVNEWIRESPTMPVVGRDSGLRFWVDVGRSGDKPIVVGVELADCERRV